MLVGASDSNCENVFRFFKDEEHNAIRIGRHDGDDVNILSAIDEAQRRMSKSCFERRASPTVDLVAPISQDRLAHEEDRQRT